MRKELRLDGLFTRIFNRKWLLSEDIDIYVRFSQRAFGGHSYKLLDVANVEAVNPGQGVFTEWLSYAEQFTREAGVDGVFVENVLNERLLNFLVRRGYSVVPNSVPPCLILVTGVGRE